MATLANEYLCVLFFPHGLSILITRYVPKERRERKRERRERERERLSFYNLVSEVA
jgi:hypothetical protein